MSNLIKKLFLTLLILIFVSFIPIYGMVRFVVPDIIIDKISEKLPKGSKFSVKTVKSNLDMSISYEGVFYSDPMVNVIIPELTVKTLKK